MSYRAKAGAKYRSCFEKVVDAAIAYRNADEFHKIDTLFALTVALNELEGARDWFRETWNDELQRFTALPLTVMEKVSAKTLIASLKEAEAA